MASGIRLGASCHRLARARPGAQGQEAGQRKGCLPPASPRVARTLMSANLQGCDCSTQRFYGGGPSHSIRLRVWSDGAGQIGGYGITRERGWTGEQGFGRSAPDEQGRRRAAAGEVEEVGNAERARLPLVPAGKVSLSGAGVRERKREMLFDVALHGADCFLQLHFQDTKEQAR